MNNKILNVNGLNTLTKRQRMSDWTTSVPKYTLPARHTVDVTTQTGERMEKMYHAKTCQERAEVVLVIKTK